MPTLGEWGNVEHVWFMHSVSEVKSLSVPVRSSHTAAKICRILSFSSFTFAPLLTSASQLEHISFCCFSFPHLKLWGIQQTMKIYRGQTETVCRSYFSLNLNLSFSPSVLPGVPSCSWPLRPKEKKSEAQTPMGRPVIQHALLLLQCMLVLRPCGVASRRGPVLLPESPCYKTEHPLIPHSGKLSKY